MLELKNVNYDELVEMDLGKAKEIVGEMEDDDFLGEISCLVNGIKYEVYVVDEGVWEDGGKYQYRTDIGLLCKVEEDNKMTLYDIAITQNITRCGSYFSEYNYEFDPLEVNKVVQKVIPQQIIPERTVVTIEEEFIWD